MGKEKVIEEIDNLIFYIQEEHNSIHCNIIDKSMPGKKFDRNVGHLIINDLGNGLEICLSIRDDIYDRIKWSIGESNPFAGWDNIEGYPENYIYLRKIKEKRNTDFKKAVNISSDIGSKLLKMISRVY